MGVDPMVKVESLMIIALGLGTQFHILYTYRGIMPV